MNRRTDAKGGSSTSLTVRLTTRERRAIVGAAKRKGISISSWMRIVLMGVANAIPKPRGRK